jgi:hypothetical protein
MVILLHVKIVLVFQMVMLSRITVVYAIMTHLMTVFKTVMVNGVGQLLKMHVVIVAVMLNLKMSVLVMH